MSVLIVEDDDATADALRELLRLRGYEAHCAADGRSALERLREGPVCLVLLDLRMPVMDGYEFRERQLQEPFSEVPVVLVTADAEGPRKARELKVAGYLQKPIRPEELLRIVSEFCSKDAA